MKTRTFILATAALALMAIVPNAAKAQDPFKDLTKNDVVATFKVPDIVDFVTFFLNDPIDEQRESVATEWQKYLKNEKPGKGVSFVVDKKNGYIRYENATELLRPHIIAADITPATFTEELSRTFFHSKLNRNYNKGEKSIVEYCYWNCADGLHKLFAENVKLTRNDKPVFAQLTGLYIFVYDNATQKLYRVDQTLLGLGGEVTAGEVTFDLPRFGKDIEMYANGTQKKLVWNGKGFTLKNK